MTTSEIARSHERCRRRGMDPTQAEFRTRLSDADTGALLRQTELQRHRAIELFVEVCGCIEDANLLFVLTDNRGYVLEVFSGKRFKRETDRSDGLGPGVCLAEESAGTNAFAMCLRTGEDSVIKGEDHYFHGYADWMCVASPIRKDHRTLGCVAIAGMHNTPLNEKRAVSRFIATELVQVFDEKRCSLTRRQYEVLVRYAAGHPYKKIAHDIELRSIKTVQEHLDAVRTKLGVANRRECIREAIATGLLRPDAMRRLAEE